MYKCHLFHGFYYSPAKLGDLHDMVHSFLCGESITEGLMLLCGVSGCGKTTLIQAVTQEAQQLNMYTKIMSLTEYIEKLFVYDEIGAAANVLLPEFEPYGLIAIEDYSSMCDKLVTQDIICEYLLKPLLESGKKIILSMNQTHDIAVLKLPGHLRIDLAHADTHVKLQYLRDYCNVLKLEPDYCTQIFLASNYPIHVIKGILNRESFKRQILTDGAYNHFGTYNRFYEPAQKSIFSGTI